MVSGRRVGGRADFDQLARRSRPQSRSRAIILPWGRWNSTESSPGHSTPCMPKSGRRSSVARRDRLVVGAAEDREDRVDEEDELAAGAQQARRLGDPGVGVAPDARPVLGDREVEGGVGVGHLLGVAVEEGELEARTPAGRRAPSPAGLASCRCRPGGRRGGPARRRRSRCRSRARSRRGPSIASGSRPTSDSGTEKIPRSVPRSPSCAGPNRHSRAPARPSRRGCARRARGDPSPCGKPRPAQEAARSPSRARRGRSARPVRSVPRRRPRAPGRSAPVCSTRDCGRVVRCPTVAGIDPGLGGQLFDRQLLVFATLAYSETELFRIRNRSGHAISQHYGYNL